MPDHVHSPAVSRPCACACFCVPSPAEGCLPLVILKCLLLASLSYCGEAPCYCAFLGEMWGGDDLAAIHTGNLAVSCTFSSACSWCLCSTVGRTPAGVQARGTRRPRRALWAAWLSLALAHVPAETLQTGAAANSHTVPPPPLSPQPPAGGPVSVRPLE